MRVPDVVSARETEGRTTSFSAVSHDEEGEAAQQFRELYADLVRKAEADLELESVPVAYREYLRRYFRAIRPAEDDSDPAGETMEEPP